MGLGPAGGGPGSEKAGKDEEVDGLVGHREHQTQAIPQRGSRVRRRLALMEQSSPPQRLA